MRCLALEGYYGGSHRAFLDGWVAHSSHEWTLVTLPAYKWKWRMRHGAITFADEVRKRLQAGESWDVLFCSDMLNLAEFRGLLPELRIPAVVYFHENQLTYPVRVESERDYQFAMTNITTALAAQAVWFNSAFHREEFLTAITAFLRRMPDYQPFDAVERIWAKSSIQPPGIIKPKGERKTSSGPLHILWAARWEHDKNPEDFFTALSRLKRKGFAFCLSVIGEQFRDQPEIFAQAHQEFADRIVHWGYQPTRQAYEQALSDADVVVSTANHEFFGLSVIEAIAAGAWPLLPNRLAYPEILDKPNSPDSQKYFYDGTVDDLTDQLTILIESHQSGRWDSNTGNSAQQLIERYYWPVRAEKLDEILEGYEWTGAIK